jgi:hypothetical protein
MRVTSLFRSARRAFAIAIALGMTGASSHLGAQDALSLDEVIELRRSGVSIFRILEVAREFCVAFAMSDTVEQRLAEGESDTTLVNGLRRACVVTPTPELPPGVLYDDDFKSLAPISRFSPTDQLCAARAHARGLRLDNQRQNGGCVIALPSDIPGTNVRVELTIAQLSGEANALAVLGFGKQANSWDQFTFGITKDAHFEFGLSLAGKFRRILFDKVPVDLAGPSAGEQRIAVEIHGRTIVLYVNERVVGTHRADEPIARGLALGVGPRSDVVFGRLLVRRSDDVAKGP